MLTRLIAVVALLGVFATLGLGLRQIESQADRIDELRQELALLRASSKENAKSVVTLHKLAFINRSLIHQANRRRKVTVTAYSPREQETDSTPTLTATNNKVRHGIVAVSRDLFQQGWVFGRRVYIQGEGVFVIDDLMAKDKRRQLDIFMHDTQDALRFGAKKREAYLLGA
ncbi:3D domain-containing protein [Desulfohalovibrio reitneri]|uniref:3D domain-containing protein n=1 Tax=Desulfohalovibrio reitneri TaxID=1307759 RepID=UPI000690E8F3|nr:3D domain-containing protein [Desulfohalovibrio reitneri]